MIFKCSECDNSCNTCSGITANDCLSCNYEGDGKFF